MIEWGDPIHESHTPDEPRDIGFGTGLVYCLSCGTLLRSNRGVAINPKVGNACAPVPVEHRGWLAPPAQAPRTTD